MGLTELEASELFNAPFKPDAHTISFHGLKVDFLEEGFRLTLDLVQANSREVRTSDFSFSVVGPAILYSDKCALIANKARPQDPLHHKLLAEFLKCELCTDLEKPGALIARDERLKRRLILTIAASMTPELRPLKRWAKHHLPGYTE